MDFTVNVNFLKQKNKRKKILHHISEAIIVVSSFLLVFPFYGTIDYHLAHSKSAPEIKQSAPNYRADNTATLLAQGIKNLTEIYSQLQKIQTANTASAESMQTEKNVPARANTNKKEILENMLYIPKIGVEINIVEGKDEKALFMGAWRIPGTSTPDAAGNMVIGGHRWRFKPPSKRTFYNLDKLEIGDKIIVQWAGQEYVYRVRETKIVKPEEVEILENTPDNILTLFTCTPLFSTKFRLVIIAEKI